jgi:4-amino-4-deoxy-L-arabinose transferase-like glycosyltransferase
MPSLWFFAPDLLTIGLLALAAFVFGRRLCRRLTFDSTLECVAISTALGLGTIALVAFLIGLMGALTRPVILSGALLGFLACYPVWRTWLWDLFDGLRRLRTASSRMTRGLALAAVVAVPILTLALYPPTSWDATMYHLPMAKAYVHAHRVEITPFFRYPVFPQLNEMLFSLALLFASDLAAQLIQSLMLTLTALLVYTWGRRIASPRAGLWAAAMWLGTPVVIDLGTVAMIDIGLGLFVMAAFYALSRWRSGNERPWLVIAGLFAGFAAGSKYTALFFLGALAFASVYSGLRHHRWSAPAIFCLAALLTGAPWYIYNAVVTGNPVFPFFGQIFGYGPWSAEDVHFQLKEMASHGLGRSPLALLALPWNLLVHRTAFNMTAPLSPFYLLLSPVILVAGVAQRRVRGLLSISLGYVLFWFATVQVARYLIPVLPFLSLLAGAGLDRIASRWLPSGGRGGRGLALVLLVASALVAPGWLYAIYRVGKHGSPPASVVTRDTYLARRLPSYPAYKLLNERHGTRYRVYSLRRENMAYFADGTFMGDWFGPARFSQIFGRLGDARALYAELNRLGADYFLVSTERGNVRLPDDTFFRDHFKLVYAQGPVTLFRLVD